MHHTKLPRTEPVATARHQAVLSAAIREGMGPLKFLGYYEPIEGAARSGMIIFPCKEPFPKSPTSTEVARAILKTTDTAVYSPRSHSLRHKAWEVRRGVLAPVIVIWTRWLS